MVGSKSFSKLSKHIVKNFEIAHYNYTIIAKFLPIRYNYYVLSHTFICSYKNNESMQETVQHLSKSPMPM